MNTSASATSRAVRLSCAWAMAVVGASCAGPEQDTVTVSQGTVLQNVAVVDTRSGAVHPHMSVVVEADKITRVLPARLVRTGGTAQVIDASGRYVVPGYIDMHTHVLPMIDSQPGLWSVLLAHGITGVRQMQGSAGVVKQAREINRRSKAGEINAPEIVAVPGDIVLFVPDGQAAAVVAQQKAAGADFIKLVASPREGALALFAEARQAGLPVAGHLPLSVTSLEAAQAGMHAFEHLGALPGIPLDCSAQSLPIRRDFATSPRPTFTPQYAVNPVAYRPADVPLYQRVVDSYDDALCNRVVDQIAASKVWQVPTLIRLRTMERSNDPAFRNDPNNALVDRTTLELWRQLDDQYAKAVPADGQRMYQRLYDLQRQIVKMLKQRGVPMLSGSDVGGVWLVPGWSLHQEFRELASAGLSPLEVLQSTTINGARFLKREATMGSVDEGKQADLVLLEANPLDDVANLNRIAGLFLNGRYQSKQQLEKMKDAAAKSYASRPVGNVLSVIDPNHRH